MKGGADPFFYLKDRLDTFHVFIYAPLAEKVKRLGQRGGTRRKRSTLLRPWTVVARRS